MRLKSYTISLHLISEPLPNNRKGKTFHVKMSDIVLKCLYCDETHSIFFCKHYLENSVKSRLKFVEKKHLCLNCLSPGHNYIQCLFSKRCIYCNEKHHSSLHEELNERSLRLQSKNFDEPTCVFC